MIKKFAKIANVFSYSYFDWDKMNPEHGQNPNDPIDIFKKNNIIFAENGNGKSALVSIIKSLNGQPVKLETHWDHPGTDPQEIKALLFDDSEIDFSNTGWSSDGLHGKFLIFDKFFTDEYVHSVGPDNTDTAQRRQRRGKNIVYLGNFAEYNNEVDRVNTLKDKILQKANRFIETERVRVSAILDGSDITLEELLNKKAVIKKLKESELKDDEIKFGKLTTELEKIDKALKEKNKIATLPTLSNVCTSLSLEIEDEEGNKETLNPSKLFSFTVAEGVQKTLHKIAHKKDFVQEGLSLVEGKVCPFCEQKIKNGDYIQIIKDYQEIFDENFSNEEDKIKKLLTKYKNVLEELIDLQAPSNNQTNLNTIKQYITTEIELPQLILTSDEKTIVRKEIDLVFQKQQKILEKIESSHFTEVSDIIKKAIKLIEDYNKVTKEINKNINQLKNDSTKGKLNDKKTNLESETAKLEKKIFYLKNKKSIEKYYEAEESNQKNRKVVESLERIYQALKDEVVEKFNKFVSEYFGLIKGFVKEINPSMDILDIAGQATLDRRSPRDSAQCGFRIKYNGKDCTGNLSEGEKQVVALSFFFAQLRKEPNKNKVVVLDDPITSLDAGKRKSTAEVIQKETKNFEQLFILTCDPLFREYCLKQVDNRNFYYIFKTRGSSSIHYHQTKKVSEFVNSVCDKFEEDFANLDNFNGDDENIIIFGQKLRFCLETKIKEDYFGYSQDKLSNMIEQVAKDGAEKFEKLINNKETILGIYNYCNTGGLAHYPRDGSTSWNELKDKIKQYLSLRL